MNKALLLAEDVLTIEKTHKPRIDGQISSLAGEFFVAAELLKRELQTSVTFGNAKAIDLFTYNPRTKRSFNVQVKALRYKNFFPISSTKVHREHIYVFVLLNKPGAEVEYFIVPGYELLTDFHRFGKGYLAPKFPCIHPRKLEQFRNNWGLFEYTTDEENARRPRQHKSTSHQKVK